MTAPPGPLAQRLDLVVAADPAACQRAAMGLEALGSTSDGVAERLRRWAAPCPSTGGVSDAAYRASARALADQVHGLSLRAGGLAGGLAAYAEALAEVRRLMELARTTAAPWLTTTATSIWCPERHPDPADAELSTRWTVWHDASARCREARELEHDAEERWRRVLDAVTWESLDGPTPGPTVTKVVPPDLGASWVRPAGAGDVEGDARFERRPPRPRPWA